MFHSARRTDGIKMKTPVILAINPGSTSTKIAVTRGVEPVFEKNIQHPASELKKFAAINDQFGFRRDLVASALKEAGINLSDIDIFMGRGGLVRPIESGVWEVNDVMVADLQMGIMGQHACNLGGLIARSLADEAGVKAYIADPVVVDEMSDVAHVGGHPLTPRYSIFHALNQKAVARRYCKERGVDYDSVNLIVAHMGGGVSIGTHISGRVDDVNNALVGEGPFSVDRSGTLPAGTLADMCFSGNYDEKEIRRIICGAGGVVAHLGHGDMKKAVDDALAGDAESALIVDAFAYNVAKAIGAAAVVCKGRVEAILLTGGIAYSKHICDKLTEAVEFIAPVAVYGGENEMLSLAENAVMLWEGRTQNKVYGF